MNNKNAEQSYSTYFKAISATVFTISSFLIAKSTGYLFGSADLGEENKGDEDIKGAVDLRRSIVEIINQETPQSLQLVNSTSTGSFGISDIQDMVVKNNIAYIAAGNAGLQVFNITNVTSPILIGQYQRNDTFQFTSRVNVFGKYAYIADGAAGFTIIDLSNLNNLTVAGSYMMEKNVTLFFALNTVSETETLSEIVVTNLGTAANSTMIINAEQGRFTWIDVSQPTLIFRKYFYLNDCASFFISNNIIYISDGLSFLSINASDPTNLDLLGNFTLPGISQIKVVNNIAYTNVMAFVYMNSTGWNQFNTLQLINVSDLSNVTLLGNITLPRNTKIIDLGIIGNIVYVVGLLGIELINATDPNNLSIIGSVSTNSTYSIDVVNDIAYTTTDFGLQLMNISIPDSPSLLGNFATYNFAAGVSVVDNIAYVPLSTAGAIQLIDISNPNNLSLLGNLNSSEFFAYSKFNTLGLSISFSVVDQIVYLPTILGLQKINVSDPTNPSLLEVNDIGELAVKVIGDLAYMCSSSGLEIINVGMPSNLVRTSFIDDQKSINDVFVLGDLIFYTQQNRGLIIFNNQNNALIHNIYNYGSLVWGLNVVGDIVYIADDTAGLQLVNASDLNNPRLLGNFGAGRVEAYSVSVSNNTAYVSDGNSGRLQIINVSDPMNLTLLASFPIWPLNVKILGDIAYINDGSCVQILDVTNPSNSSMLGNFCSSVGSIGIDVVSDIAYAVGNLGLELFNVTDSLNPYPLGSFSAQQMSSIFAIGNVVYVGQYPFGFQVIDVTDVSNPSLLGQFNISGFVNSITVVDDIAYVGTAITGGNVALIDINDPAYPDFLRNYQTPRGQSLNDGINQVVISGNYAYVADSTKGAEVIRLFLDKSNFSPDQTASQITAQNNTAYLSDVGKNLYILDITNISNPIEVGRYLLSSWSTDMVVSGNYLYVAEGIDGVEVIDISNSIQPVFAGYITQGFDNARTLQIDGNTLYVNNNNVEMLVFDMTVLHYLNVSINKVDITQGTTTVTNKQLDVIAVNPFDPVTGDINNIVYTISNLQQGQFELVNTAIPITSFTQAQINNNSIQFLYTGNGTNPSFDFTLNDGNITAGPFVANIVLLHLPQIVLNKIICNEGQSVLVTSTNISAIDIDGVYNPNLLFIVNEMSNSQFEFNTTPGVIAIQFTQQNLTDNLIRFVQIDGADTNDINDVLPSYQLTVTNGKNQSAINNATIDFDAAPKIIQNQLTISKGGSVVLTSANLNSTDIDNHFLGNLRFQVSNVTNGQFELIKNPNIPLFNFTQQEINNRQIQFVQDNSDNSPNYVVNVTDGRATSPMSSPTVSFNNKEAGLNAGLIAGGVVGGIAGLAALIAGSGFFAKNYRDATTRKPHPFANAVQSHLKLEGMDNFKTEQGQRFVRLMEEDMVQALIPYGFDIQNMHPKAVDDLSQNIAREAKNKITGSTTLFGYSEIRLNQLENKISDIAEAVSQYKDIGQIKNSTLENDNEIGLKNFIPSFSLSGNKFENV